jgi:hypothetical protein
MGILGGIFLTLGLMIFGACFVLIIAFAEDKELIIPLVCISIGIGILNVGSLHEVKTHEKIAIENGYAKQIIIDPVKGETKFMWVHEITNR